MWVRVGLAVCRPEGHRRKGQQAQSQAGRQPTHLHQTLPVWLRCTWPRRCARTSTSSGCCSSCNRQSRPRSTCQRSPRCSHPAAKGQYLQVVYPSPASQRPCGMRAQDRCVNPPNEWSAPPAGGCSPPRPPIPFCPPARPPARTGFKRQRRHHNKPGQPTPRFCRRENSPTHCCALAVLRKAATSSMRRRAGPARRMAERAEAIAGTAARDVR